MESVIDRLISKRVAINDYTDDMLSGTMKDMILQTDNQSTTTIDSKDIFITTLLKIKSQQQQQQLQEQSLNSNKFKHINGISNTTQNNNIDIEEIKLQIKELDNTRNKYIDKLQKIEDERNSLLNRLNNHNHNGLYIDRNSRNQIITQLKSFMNIYYKPKGWLESNILSFSEKLERTTYNNSKTKQEYLNHLENIFNQLYVNSNSFIVKTTAIKELNNQINNINDNINKNNIINNIQPVNSNNIKEVNQEEKQQDEQHDKQQKDYIDEKSTNITITETTISNNINKTNINQHDIHSTLSFLPNHIAEKLNEDYYDSYWTQWRDKKHSKSKKLEENLIKKYYDISLQNGLLFDGFMIDALSIVLGRDKEFIREQFAIYYKASPFLVSRADDEIKLLDILNNRLGIKLNSISSAQDFRNLINQVNQSFSGNIDTLYNQVIKLSPQELTSISQTTHTYLNRSTEPIIKKKKCISPTIDDNNSNIQIFWEHKNVAKGNLSFPLPAKNEVDTKEIEPFQWISKSFCNLEPEVELKDFQSGCTCIGDCHNPENISKCQCLKGVPNYENNQKLRYHKMNGHDIVEECNDRCKCNHSRCGNRVIQKGQQYPLELFKSKLKGWGVRTLADIPDSTFVTEYVGEIITNDEAEERGKGYDQDKLSYLYDMEVPNRENFCIDAMQYGNESRFMNHSCDPNLRNIMLSDSDDERFLRFVFFSSRPIKKGEELTIDYNYQFQNHHTSSQSSRRSSTKNNDIDCHCGSNNCRKVLWRSLN